MNSPNDLQGIAITVARKLKDTGYLVSHSLLDGRMCWRIRDKQGREHLVDGKDHYHCAIQAAALFHIAWQ